MLSLLIFRLEKFWSVILATQFQTLYFADFKQFSAKTVHTWYASSLYMGANTKNCSKDNDFQKMN